MVVDVVTTGEADPIRHLDQLADEPILVRCPACGGPARSSRSAAGSGKDRVVTYRLTCTGCGHARSVDGLRTFVFGEAIDPFFRADLWLQAPCAGHVLWAYHGAHLDLLAGFVGATTRNPGRSPGTNQTVVERLPRWMTDAHHRDEVLRTIDSLRLRIPG